MTARRELETRELEGGVELDISALRSNGELVGDAARTGAFYTGIAGASGLALTVLYAMTRMPENYVMRGLRNFAEAMATALPAVGAYGVPLFVAMFAIVSVASAWGRRAHTSRYRITCDGERLRCSEESRAGERTTLDVDVENIVEVQAGRSNDSDVDKVTADPWEITVITDDEIRIFGAGLDEEDCRRAVESLDDVIAEAHSMTDTADEVVLDFADESSSAADSETATQKDVAREPSRETTGEPGEF